MREHKLTIKHGFESYKDVEFGPSGHSWAKAICSCGWRSKQCSSGDHNQQEAAAKVAGFDHLVKKQTDEG